MAKIFFTPGLGGERTIERQRNYVHFLNSLGKSIYFFDPKWQSNESAEVKKSRLDDAYDKAGRPRKLFGVSAGASMAVVLGAAFPDTEIITLAGKHTGAASIGEEYDRRAPAFRSFVMKSEAIIEADSSVAHRIKSYRPWPVDGVVPMHDIVVPGAANRLIPVPFHTPAIIAGLATVLPRDVSRLTCRQADSYCIMMLWRNSISGTGR